MVEYEVRVPVRHFPLVRNVSWPIQPGDGANLLAVETVSQGLVESCVSSSLTPSAVAVDERGGGSTKHIAFVITIVPTLPQ